MRKYKSPWKYTPAQTRCKFDFMYLYFFFTYMYFLSCEREANIHTYANVNFPLISSKIDRKNRTFLC